VLKAFGRRVLANIYLHCVFDLWADDGESAMPEVRSSSCATPMASSRLRA
jgi:hypothetical protein